jgi:hypothetical protein
MEQIMRKSAASIFALGFAIVAAAQQPQQCLNPGLVNGLVFLGSSDRKVTVAPGQPAFMSGHSVTTGVTLIGSGVRGDGLTLVAYKSALSTDKAYAAILGALGADGWGQEPSAGSATTFSVAGSPRNASLCRDGERRAVMVMQVEGQSYVSVVALPEARRTPCGAGPDMSMGLMMGGGAAPRFQFPEGTSIGFGTGAGGGSNTLFTNTSRIISPESPARLVQHLSSQIEQQGWQQDSDWSAGGASAGSTWRKRIDGVSAWGTLEIIRVSEQTYDVDFTIALPQ